MKRGARRPPEFNSGDALHRRYDCVASSSDFSAATRRVVSKVVERCRGLSVAEIKQLGGFSRLIREAIELETQDETTEDWGLFGTVHPLRETLLQRVSIMREIVQYNLSKGLGR